MSYKEFQKHFDFAIDINIKTGKVDEIKLTSDYISIECNRDESSTYLIEW